MNRLNILEHTASVIHDIQNPELDYNIKDWSMYFLFDSFEYAGREISRKEVGQATAMVFTKLLVETNEQTRGWLFDILEVAVMNNHDVYEYIDFDVLIAFIARFPPYADRIVFILGYSHNVKYVPLIEQYIGIDEVEVFAALCRLCWDVSGRSPEVGQMLRRDEVREIEFLLINPKRRTVSEAELQERYLVIRKEVFAKMKLWFERYNKEQHRNIC